MLLFTICYEKYVKLNKIPIEAALKSAVWPSLSVKFGFAPLANNNSITFKCPTNQMKLNLLRMVFTNLLLLLNIPCLLARYNGVLPKKSGAFTSAPNNINVSTMRAWPMQKDNWMDFFNVELNYHKLPLHAARCNGVECKSSKISTSVPWLTNCFSIST